MISYAVSIIFKIIYLMIILVVLFSWIPIFDVRKEPFATLIRFYNIIVSPIRKFVPPIAGLDFSPLIAFILLEVFEQLLIRMLTSLGL